MGDEIGSLTPGKRGDVILVNLRDASVLGVEDPVEALLAYGHVGCVDTVIVGGKIVKRAGRLLNVDEERIHGRVIYTQRRLLAGL